MSFNTKSYFTSTDMFNSKIKLQSNIFFRLISLDQSKNMFSKHKFHNIILAKKSLCSTAIKNTQLGLNS